MKGISLIILLASFACSGKVTIGEDEIMPGIFYVEGSLKPFSGKCIVVVGDTGQVLEQFSYKNGLLCGKAFIWYRNGQLKRQGSYRDGELSGKWEFWDEKGNKIMEASYENDELNGAFVTMTVDGKVKEKGTYAANQRTGKWISNIDEIDERPADIYRK
jgi:antitoxin component YwqK of YwqJK toxin-antitoxin module